MRYSNKQLLHEEQFTKWEILDAALIVHPRQKQVNLTKEELSNILICEDFSNLTPLENPIIDKYKNYKC